MTTLVRERLLLLGIALGAFSLPLNSTVIVLALPAIEHDMVLAPGSTSWLVTAYLIASCVLLPVAGKVADRLGHRNVLLGGLALAAAAALGAALAGNLATLVVCRMAQAAGGAMLRPAGAALLRGLVAPERLGGRFGMLGSATTVAAAVGPVVGGVLLAAGGWRSIFWINLPLLLVPLVIVRGVAPRDARQRAASRFDPFGLFRPLAEPGYVASVIGVALGNFALYGLLLAVPVLLSRSSNVSETLSGMIVAAMTVGMAVGSPVGGRLADRVGHRAVAASGLGLAACGAGLLAVAPEPLALPVLVPGLAAAGVGIGLSAPALQLGVVRAVRSDETATAVGLAGSIRYLGSIASSSLLAGALAPAAVGAGYTVGFATFAALPVVGAAVVLMVPSAARSWRVRRGHCVAP